MTDRSLGGTATPRTLKVALWVALAALVVGLALFGSLAVAAYLDADDEASVAQPALTHGADSERRVLLDRTREFALAFMTYGPKDLEGEKLTAYRERVAALITDKFEPSFQEEAVIPEQLVLEHQVRSAARVFGVGVVEVSSDQATTLVAVEATAYQGKSEYGSASLFRFEVTLRKIDGDWLVDDFHAVKGGGAQ